MREVRAGGDVHVVTQNYFVSRGIVPFQDYLDGVIQPKDLANQGVIEVDDLRKKLSGVKSLPHPVVVTVTGTLFPCALLAAGWWDRHSRAKHVSPAWHDDLQKWLFHGFDLWGPSWDFTWNFDEPGTNPHVIAQLGSGDEADSIPVIIPGEKAERLTELFLEGWGGMEVEVTGLLGHRRQFAHTGAHVELVGGLLDYCLWIDRDNDTHGIDRLSHETDIYSGYLWKCVAPKAWHEQNRILALDQVYFIWEHTNFRDKDAIHYNLDSLAHKEEYIARMHGELVLLQKSSQLVPGRPLWSAGEFYDTFVGRKKKIV